MKDKYYEITITSNEIELFKDFVFELGVDCIEEINQEEKGFIIREEDDIQNLVFAIQSYQKALNDELHKDVTLSIKIEEKANKDWIDEYKKSINPIEVGDFYIRPTWEKANDKFINIVIDPALAFGSGHHESTNSCIFLLQKYVKNLQKDNSNRMLEALDVGCGSGILSIALAKLDCKVSSCDTDELAVISTKSNADKNFVNLEKVWLGSADKAEKEFDIVVANIIADIIIMLQKDLKKSVKNGGILVLSGILDKYFDRIQDSFKEFEILEVKQLGEWLSIALKKH